MRRKLYILACILPLFITSQNAFSQGFPTSCKGTVHMLPIIADTFCQNTDAKFQAILPSAYFDSARFYLANALLPFDSVDAFKIETSITFSSTGQQTISLFVKDTLGCVDSDSITVFVKPNPVPIVTRSGDTLFVNTSDSVNWYLNDSVLVGQHSNFLILDSSGYYSVTRFGTNGCNETSDKSLFKKDSCFVAYIFTASPVSPVPDTICQNTGLTLSAITIPDVANIEWRLDGMLLKSDSGSLNNFPFYQIVNFPDSGFHTISIAVTDTNGCQATDSATVYVKRNPLPVFTQGVDTLFVNSPAQSFSWIINGDILLNSSNLPWTFSWVPITGSGLYSVAAIKRDDNTTSNKICVASKDIYINLEPFCLDAALSAGDSVICEGEVVTLKAVIPLVYLGNTVLKLDASVLSTSTIDSANNLLTLAFSALDTGFHSATLSVSDGLNCQDFDSIGFYIAPKPVPATSQNGDTLTANSPSAVSFQWLFNDAAIPGATGISYVMDTTGFYSLLATNASGCSEVSSPIVNAADSCYLHLALIKAGQEVLIDSICVNECYELSSFVQGGFVNGTWYVDSVIIATDTASVSSKIIQSLCFPDTGWHTIILNVQYDSCAVSDSLMLYVFEVPATHIYQINELLVDTLEAETYTWYMNLEKVKESADSSLIICASNYYEVTTTFSNGCTSSDAGYFNLGDGCGIGALIALDTVCQNTEFRIKAYLPDNYYRVDWDFNGTIVSLDTSFVKRNLLIYDFTFTSPGLKTVRLHVLNCAGCEDTDSVMIYVRPNTLESIYQLADTLYSTAAEDTFEWKYNGLQLFLEKDSFITMPNSGYYNLKVKRSNGCQANAQGYFYNNPCSFVNAKFTRNPSVICSGDSVSLTSVVKKDIFYDWQLDGNSFGSTSSLKVPINNPGIAIIELIASEATGTCFDSSSQNVLVHPSPTAQAGTDFTLCINGSTRLDATGGFFYNWTPATFLSDASIRNPFFTLDTSVSNGDTLNYTVTVSDTNSCSDTDDIIISVGNHSFVNISNDTIICNGDSVQLNATGGNSYFWSGQNSLSNPLIGNPKAFPSDTTTYTVISNNNFGCKDTASVTVNVFPPVPADAGANVSICLGGSAQLQASGGVTYIWSPVTGLSNPNIRNPFAFPSSNITYTVQVTDTNGCKATDQVSVSIGGALIPNAGTDFTICEGQTKQLQAFGGTTYNWSPAAGLNNPNISNPLFSGTSTTEYIVSVSDGVCNGQDTLLATVNPKPPVPLITKSGDELSTFPGYMYQWYLNDVPISGATNISHTATANGTYKVKITHIATGCFNISDGLSVSVTGIEEADNKTEIVIYPNPNDGEFLLKISGQKNQQAEIRIYNVIGNAVLEEEIVSENGKMEKIIRMENFPSGLYFVQVRWQDVVTTNKVMLNR